MTQTDDTTASEIVDSLDDDQPVDGRVARRQRNIDAVIDTVLEMFGEESMFPTIEQAATRSGLSLRSVYRYFPDPEALVEASIQRSRQQGSELIRLHAIGEGDFDARLEDFVAVRLRLYEKFGSVYRATAANGARLPRIRVEQARNRNDLRDQFEQQFAPELAKLKRPDRDAAVSSGDLLTQLESIDYLRRHRELSQAEAKKVVKTSLTALLVK